MPKFSVIVPVYNAEKYLDQCITSILEQNYKDFELILVNDCSTDTSYEICKRYEEQNAKVLVLNQTKNLGVSAARNLGIEESRGKYILFIDSDDFVSEDYFQKMELLTENEEYELISFGNYDYIVDNDGKTETKHSVMNVDVSFGDNCAWSKLFLDSFFASSWNKIFLREILVKENIRFDTECVCYEDYLFNVEYCKYITRFSVSKHSLYYYRTLKNVNPVSKRNWGRRFEISEKVATKTNEFIDLKSGNENLSILRRFTYRAFMVELAASFYFGDNYELDGSDLINNEYFLESVESLKPAGKKVILFKIAKKLHFNKLCQLLLYKMMS